jgi:nucleotide-binding universal stress UspA family protein
MPETIVLALDGGVASIAALEWTLARAARRPMDVRLTTIDESESTRESPTERLEAVRALGHAAGRFSEAAPQCKIEMVMRSGNAVDVLVQESRTADLVVIGSNRVGTLAGVFNATLPLRLAPRTQSPLVVVPAEWTPSLGPVIVGIDEPTSTAAHEFAAREAERLGRELVLVRAWELPPTMSPEFVGSVTIDDAIREANSELLETAAAGVHRRHRGLALREKLVYAVPSQALVGEARDMELVVIGTHRRHELAEWMLGSVGHDLVMHLPCPVAIVPEPDSASPLVPPDVPGEEF